MNNYFMVYRPFHVEYVKKIIKDHLTSDKNVLVNHYKTQYQTNASDDNAEIINLPQHFFQKAKALRQVKKKLVALAKSNEQITVFIPHTLGILSNFAYFKLVSRYKNVKINVFYEGVIVFYGYDHDYMENIGYYISRWFVSLFSGILYTIDKRLLNLNDDRIRKIYTPFTNLDADQKKIVETPLEKVDYQPLKNSCIILGLKLDDKYKLELPKIITNIYNKLDDLKIDRIFFKDHPSEKSELFYSIANDMGKTLEIIDSTSPIENIIGDYCPEYVISTWSSGVINLSNMLPKSVNLFCFVTPRLTESDEDKKLVDAFREQKIEIINVD